MKNQINLLIAFDGSDQSMDITRYAGQMFPAGKTKAHLFHVASEVPEAFLDLRNEPGLANTVISASSWSREVRKNIESRLARARSILQKAGFPPNDIQTTYQKRKKGIARDIIAESHHGYDLLLIGRSGVSQLLDVVVGSVANKVLTTTAHLPVAVIGGCPSEEKALIGFDRSVGAARAVDCAGHFLAQDDREIMLCHVVRSLNIFLRMQNVFRPEDEKLWLDESSQVIEPALSEAENQLIQAGYHPSRVYKQILENETTRAGGLVQAARAGGFGTILVGRRGLSSVKDFFMGRVSRKVIHMADRMAVWVV